MEEEEDEGDGVASCSHGTSSSLLRDEMMSVAWYRFERSKSPRIANDLLLQTDFA